MQPDFNMNTVSVVSNRNSFRKLFDFACNKADRNFRIDVDMIYDTMFFTRWEPSHTQLIKGYVNFGYGHEFEKAFTTFDENLANSAGHHRIAQYSLGSLKCIMRFKADAYFDDAHEANIAYLDSDVPAETATITESDISVPFQSLSLKSPEVEVQSHEVALKSSEVESESTAKDGLTIKRNGRLIPPASIVEIKSRSKKTIMADIIPQLWLSQTKHLFVGYHRQGLIDQEPKYYDMAAHFRTWEFQHEKQLQALLGLNLRIREAIKGIDGRKGAIIYDHAEKSGKLKIYETDNTGLMALFDEEKKCWQREGK